MTNLQFPFNISADPGTDLWRKPPSTDDSNGTTADATLHILSKASSLCTMGTQLEI
jgi:hypothetical protein